MVLLSAGDDSDLRLAEVNQRSGSDLAPPPAIDLAVHPHLAVLDQDPGVCAVINDAGQLQ